MIYKIGSNPVDDPINQALGGFAVSKTGCNLTYSLVDGTDIALSPTIPVTLDSYISPTTLIVGPSTNTSLSSLSPLTVKVKAVVGLNNASIAY